MNHWISKYWTRIAAALAVVALSSAVYFLSLDIWINVLGDWTEAPGPYGVAELVRNVHPLDWVNPQPAGRYNLVVIGAGTAGLVTAAGAAGLGARVRWSNAT